MKSKRTPFNDIDSYIGSFTADIQVILEKIRDVIRQVAGDAEECISYGIPTFKLNGILVHFAAFKNHISLFPTSSGVKAFKKELKGYTISKGTIQFPIGEPIPYDLIQRIVAYRIKENLERK